MSVTMSYVQSVTFISTVPYVADASYHVTADTQSTAGFILLISRFVPFLFLLFLYTFFFSLLSSVCMCHRFTSFVNACMHTLHAQKAMQCDKRLHIGI